MSIRLENVDLGAKTIQIPVARIEGKPGGPTLLITAGNDGNEYAGIAAAYKLIETFSTTSFFGMLIIIPIVNIPGFEKEISANPMDFLYPKHIYPGLPTGKPTQRLMYWVSTFVKQSQLWLDMHDGALTERLIPFACAYRTGIVQMDKRVSHILQNIPVNYATYIPAWPFVKKLAQQGCGYIRTESSAFGISDSQGVERHVEWARVVMHVMGMAEGNYMLYPKTIFGNVREYQLKRNGIWVHNFPDNNKVKKGDVLGIVRSIDGQVIETITAKESGVLLWGKEGSRANKGDFVAGVGLNEQERKIVER